MASTTTAPAGVASTAASSCSYGFSRSSSLAVAAIVNARPARDDRPALQGTDAVLHRLRPPAEPVEDVRERRDGQRREAGDLGIRWRCSSRRALYAIANRAERKDSMGSQSFSQSMFTDLCERMLRLCKLQRGRELRRALAGRRARRVRRRVPDRRPAARREGDEPPSAVLLVRDVGRGRRVDGRQDAAQRPPARGRRPQGRGHGGGDALHALQRRADRDPAGRHAHPHLHRAGRPARADVPDRGAQAPHRRRGRGARSGANAALHERRRHRRDLPDRLPGEGAVRLRRPAGAVGPLAVGRHGAHLRRGRRDRRAGRRRSRRHPAPVQAVRAASRSSS